jgi:hypothetical protein
VKTVQGNECVSQSPVRILTVRRYWKRVSCYSSFAARIRNRNLTGQDGSLPATLAIPIYSVLESRRYGGANFPRYTLFQRSSFLYPCIDLLSKGCDLTSRSITGRRSCYRNRCNRPRTAASRLLPLLDEGRGR